MKEKIESLAAALTQPCNDTLKEAADSSLKRWTKWSKQYTKIKKKKMEKRSSATKKYILLSDDYILERNVELGKLYQERLKRDDEERDKAKDESDESSIDKISSKKTPLKRSRTAALKSPAPLSKPPLKRSRKKASKSPAPLSKSAAAAVAKSGRSSLVIDDDES